MAADVIEPAHGDQGPYVCETCGRQFSKPFALRGHQIVHRQRDAEEEPKPKQDRSPRPKTPAAPVSVAELETQLTALLTLVAMGAQMFNYPRTAAAIAGQAPHTAKAAVAWGAANSMVRKGLETLVAGGGAALVAATLVPVAMTFAEEVREKKFGPRVVENGQVPDATLTAEEPYPGTGVPGAEEFAYVAPTGDGATTTY